MSFLVVAPEWVESATADLASIRSALNTAHLAAAAPTTGIAAAGADEVSAAVASLSAAWSGISGGQRAGNAVSCRVCAGAE